MQTSGIDITLHQVIKTRLVDGYLPVEQTLYFLLIDIHTCDIDTHFGKTSTGNESYITCANIAIFIINQRYF